MSARGGKVRQILSGGLQRAEFGITCTFENASGERRTLTMGAVKPTEALRQMCDYVLALDETFLLISYSTPQTIYTDMQGKRTAGGTGSAELTGQTVHAPIEGVVLGRIGRPEMLHPSIRGTARNTENRGSNAEAAT